MDFNWINVGNLVVIMCLIAINVIAVRKKVSESFCSKYPVINIFEQIGRYGSMAFMIFPAFTKGLEIWLYVCNGNAYLDVQYSSAFSYLWFALDKKVLWWCWHSLWTGNCSCYFIPAERYFT